MIAGIRVPLPALRTGLCALAVAGAVLLVIAEFSPLVEVVVGALDTVTRSVDGGDNHSHALLPVAAVALTAAGAAWRGRRPAGPGLVALGLVALVVTLAVDLPDTQAGGDVPEALAFEDARARAGSGLGLEIAGGLALLVAGGGLIRLDFRRGPR